MKLSDGSSMVVDKIYPLDATFDTKELVPEEVAKGKRYRNFDGYDIQSVVDQVKADYGSVDFVVHSLANGPEVTKPLLDTSRAGYLAASSASAYSLVSMVSRFAPIMNPGGSVVSLTYMASEKVIPGYGGGMSSAKAALESDTRVLAFEAGRKYVNMYGLCCMLRAMAVDCSVSLLSCSISSDALGSPDLLLLYSTIVLAFYNTIILIITNLSYNP